MLEMTLAAILISVVALLVAYLSLHESKKSNTIAKQALGLNEAQAAEFARAAEPAVEVRTSTARVLRRHPEGLEILFQVHMTNLSSQADTVENLRVECDGLTFGWWSTQATPDGHLRPRDGEPSTPFSLVAGESKDYFYTFSPVSNMQPRTLLAEVVATCRRAGDCRGGIRFVVGTPTAE